MADIPIGSEVAGCRIEGVLGRGGMGVVYRATQLSLQRPVALKVIAPELTGSEDFIERFKRESRLAASIDHPNVIPVYEAGEADGLLYLIMRFVDGTDLRAVIDEQGPLEPRRAASITAQVAGALAAAHRSDLIHRDVKPANVLVTGHGDSEHAYLTDFGIARQVQATGGLTKTGMVVGTLDYIAPERIQDGAGDGRSDVYALGCVLYEALTGSVPFPRDSDVPKMYAHLSEPPPSARETRPETPEPYAQIAQRAMAKDPDERFATADEMGAALLRGTPVEPPAAATDAVERSTVASAPPTAPAAPPTASAAPPTAPAAPPTAPAAATEPAEPARVPAAPPPARPPAAPPSRRRRRWPLVAGIAAVAAVAGVAALLLSGGEDEPSNQPAGQAVEDQPPPEPLDPRALRPLELSPGADGVAVGAGSVWVANKDRNTLTRIDPAGPSVEGSVDVGREPDSVAVGLGRVWVTNSTDNTVTVVDPETERVTRTVPVGAEPEGIAIGKGFAWVANSGDDTVTRIDRNGRAQRAQRVGDEPIQITFTPDAPWITLTGDGAIARLDPSTGEPSGERVEIEGSPRGIAYADGLLWVSATKANRIVVIDPKTRREVDRVDVPDNPREVRAGEGAVWFTSAEASSVTALDSQSREIAGTVDVRGKPYGLGVGEGRAWAASLDQGLLTPVDPRP